MNSLSLNKTPAQTTTNANRVPMLAKSVTSVKFINKAGMATTAETVRCVKAAVWDAVAE